MTAGTIGQPSGEAPTHRDWWASAVALLLPFVGDGRRRSCERWLQCDLVRLDGARICVARDHRRDVITTPTWGAFDVVWLAVASCGLLSTPSRRRRGQARSAAAFDNGQRSLEYLTGIAGALLVVRRGRTQPLARRACARCCRCLRPTRSRRACSPIASVRSPPNPVIACSCRWATGTRSASSRRSERCSPSESRSLGRGRVLRILTASGARSAHVDAVLHVQPRCMAGARGRAARDVRAQPTAASAARRLDRTRADPGCRRAARVRGFRR